MQIFVKSLTDRTWTFQVEPDDNINILRRMIADKDGGLPPDDQILIFNARLIEGERQLQDYNIHQESYLHLLTRLKGA